VLHRKICTLYLSLVRLYCTLTLLRCTHMNLDCTASILHFIHTALVHPYCTSVLHGTSCTFVLSWIILHNYCNRKTPPMHCANTITVFHCTAFHPYCTCFTSVLHVYCNRTTPPMHCANAVFHCTAFHPRTALVKHLYYMERTLTGTALVRHPRCTCASLCYTLCATPCTLHPAPCTLHPAPSLHTPVLHPRATPSVLHPAPCTLHLRYTHLCLSVLHPLCYTLVLRTPVLQPCCCCCCCCRAPARSKAGAAAPKAPPALRKSASSIDDKTKNPGVRKSWAEGDRKGDNGDVEGGLSTTARSSSFVGGERGNSRRVQPLDVANVNTIDQHGRVQGGDGGRSSHSMGSGAVSSCSSPASVTSAKGPQRAGRAGRGRERGGTALEVGVNVCVCVCVCVSE